ncbi:MAG: hypothetical protein RLZZ440_2951 [Planctomycetota bacterium]
MGWMWACGMLVGVFVGGVPRSAVAVTPVNLASGGRVSASSSRPGHPPAQAVDGKISDESRWISGAAAASPAWLCVEFPARARVGGVHVHSGWRDSEPVEEFQMEYRVGDAWLPVPGGRIVGNRRQSVAVPFDDTAMIETDAIRLVCPHAPGELVRIRELAIWPASPAGIPRLPQGSAGGEIPPIYLNQSGFNLGKPKRFTAPRLPDETPFAVVRRADERVMFEGRIRGAIGDFTGFDPESRDEYVVRAGGDESVPFRVGRFWLERVTYRGSVDFMIDSRQYVGTYAEPCEMSFAWRDDHQFSFELNGLVPLYLANPSAFDNMPLTMPPVPAGDGRRWGALEPCRPDAPDIVRLIHWGADVIVTQRLDHMLLKEQLAFFLHAWPALDRWLPPQNHQVVLAYARDVWGRPGIGRSYPYDTIREDHDLFRVKTGIGTTKGENPPGHSLLPNLLMHEVAVRLGDPHASRYERAALDQASWMVAELDWNDPATTKGQRGSEHVVVAGLGMLYRVRAAAPLAGLRQKLQDWAAVAVSRSDNLWDFRRLSATQWTPTGARTTEWNEPGNVLGFPACVLAALPAVDDAALRGRLEQLVWSHFDNCFGRNPCGRHFSYDAPREIEGVEFGWYSFMEGGIGHLANSRFVFDGAPKNAHYPYHPELGNIGWTEGWIAFNSAFNASLAALAVHETKLECRRQDGNLRIRLRAAVGFDPDVREAAVVQLIRHGVSEPLEVREEADDSEWFSATVAEPAGISRVTYGHGFWQTAVDLQP